MLIAFIGIILVVNAQEYTWNDLNNIEHYEHSYAHIVFQRYHSKGSTKIGHIDISGLGEHFRLHLHYSMRVFSSMNIAVHSNLTGESTYDFEKDRILHGSVEGCSQSEVNFVDFPNVGPMGSFACNNVEYYLEPEGFFNVSDDRQLNKMILYRVSNITLPSHAFSKKLTFQAYLNDIISLQKRERRSALPPPPIEQNRCGMLVVVDYEFFRTIGLGSRFATSSYIMSMYDKMNSIFESYNFGILENSSLTNIGFEIQRLIIWEHYSNDSAHYNADDSGKEISLHMLLERFRNKTETKNYCLRHLITAKSNTKDSAVGLTHIGSTDSGICPLKKYPSQYNVLITTVTRSSSSTTHGAHLIVAHELGHAFGAYHDNYTARPDKGYYIMHQTTVSGFYENNMKFSNKSIEDIGKLLTRRLKNCFTKSKSSFCGNGIQEDKEECDEGFKSAFNCCDSSCKLKAGKKCSPINFPCCTTKCLFASSEVVCSRENVMTCSAKSFCTGNNGNCPLADASLLNDRVCFENGQCRNGTCISYCETIGKYHCRCSAEEDQCKYCCKVNSSSECSPEPNAGYYPDNSLCMDGSCQNGKCVSFPLDSEQAALKKAQEPLSWFMSNIIFFAIFFPFLLYTFIAFVIGIRKKHKDLVYGNLIDDTLVQPKNDAS